MNPLEAEARAMGVRLTPEQWQRYREWEAKNPRGGMAGGVRKQAKKRVGAVLSHADVPDE
jgi:hypothetical protein